MPLKSNTDCEKLNVESKEVFVELANTRVRKQIMEADQGREKI